MRKHDGVFVAIDAANEKGGAMPPFDSLIVTPSPMGEAKKKKSSTAKLIAEFPLCALCGGQRPSTTRDHIPPKALFDKSYRPDKLVAPACSECNGGTSTADLIASIVCRWNYPSYGQELSDHGRLVSRLRKQNPDVIDEWTSIDKEKREFARKHLEDQGVAVPPDAGFASVGKITIRYLNLFAYKTTLGLYFEHFRTPLPNTGLVSAIWRTKEDWAKDGVPKELLEIMPKYATLQQGQWKTAEQFEYRFDLDAKDGLLGCLARFRNGLYVAGFAVRDERVLPSEAKTPDWIRPADLLSILDREEFGKRIA